MTVSRCTSVAAAAATLSEAQTRWASARADAIDGICRMGGILRDVKERELYKETHSRWEDWLKWAHEDPGWALERRDHMWADALIHFPTAYRLIAEGTQGVPLPANVAQIEPYLTYKDEVIAQKWQEVWARLPKPRQDQPPSRNFSRAALREERSYTENVKVKWTPEARDQLEREVSDPNVIDLTPIEQPDLSDTYYQLALEWRDRIARIKTEIGNLEGFLVNVKAEHGPEVFDQIRAANRGISGVMREQELIAELVEGLKRAVMIAQ